MKLQERSPADWRQILALCGVRSDTAEKWGPVFASTLSPRGEYSRARQWTFSMGEAELDDFLGQILHESAMLTATVENLNYSAEALMRTWPHRFKTPKIAAEFARRPEAIANRVYGGRMGNTQEGDGWRYRGRGLIMVTGAEGCRIAGELMGQDLLVMPHLLEQPHFALEAAIAWWEGLIPDACIGDCVKVTRRVNGGLIGIDHRIEVTLAARRALEQLA